MDRADRRGSNVRFLRGTPEPTPPNLWTVELSESRLTLLPFSVFRVFCIGAVRGRSAIVPIAGEIGTLSERGRSSFRKRLRSDF